MEDDPIELPTAIPGSRAQFAGIFAGIVPFILSWNHVERVNGEITSYVDYVALAGGAVALLLGGLGLAGALKATDAGRGKRIGFSAVALLLGVVQLARGFGLFVS